ncbi:S1 family peptidase [Bacillus thuringiensis]|uniref:S1 family peptidase n=1 Tax=Bacillus thuringiensis TaxID=1428 RepID=UPI0015CF4C9F|nr:serine protease [Bacillus thuringiensis]
MPINTRDDLQYATVKINTVDSNGRKGSGTGFIVNFYENEIDGKYLSVPSIITNKHVIEGAINGLVRFHASSYEGSLAGQCEFNVDNFEKQFYLHPDKDVDLCAMPMAPLFALSSKDKIKPYYKSLSMKQVMNEADFQHLSPTQEIFAVGYPNGFWDEVNNLPIFRKGIIGTVPSVNYMGKQNFLIDCGIYPGSSGSPVLTVVPKLNSKTGEIFEDISLAGIVFATHQHNAQGKLIIENIPVNSVHTWIPNHLGIVIKSSRLFELNEIIKKAYKDTPVFDITKK